MHYDYDYDYDNDKKQDTKSVLKTKTKTGKISYMPPPLDILIKCYLRFHKFQIKNDTVHPKIEFS